MTRPGFFYGDGLDAYVFIPSRDFSLARHAATADTPTAGCGSGAKLVGGGDLPGTAGTSAPLRGGLAATPPLTSPLRRS